MKDDRLWYWFSIFIRTRDAAPVTGLAKCFTCPRIIHWKEGDCGHGIPRQHWGTRYNEQNNHLQCKACNGFEGGNQAEYMKAVDKKYGPGTWDRLRILSKKVTKIGKFEIDIMAEQYRKLAQENILKKNL